MKSTPSRGPGRSMRNQEWERITLEVPYRDLASLNVTLAKVAVRRLGKLSPRKISYSLPQQHQMSTMAATNSRKRQNTDSYSNPTKKIKILQDDDDSHSDSDGEETLNINPEYAKRFEHNKKRAELHQCMLLLYTHSLRRTF